MTSVSRLKFCVNVCVCGGRSVFNLVYFLKSLIAVISPFAFNVLADSFGLDVQSYLFIFLFVPLVLC